ncbi:hypothetical protein U0X36_05395 [Bacillus thuringiensis]|nr:hypothetical protein [Bacillus thuringiensis]MDZ3952379.1 hypothetical protein [Bacillus thuringiensis]
MVKIGKLYQKGWTIKVIFEETGFDPNTIRKYIQQDELPSEKK